MGPRIIGSNGTEYSTVWNRRYGTKRHLGEMDTEPNGYLGEMGTGENRNQRKMGTLGKWVPMETGIGTDGHWNKRAVGAEWVICYVLSVYMN